MFYQTVYQETAQTSGDRGIWASWYNELHESGFYSKRM